MKIIELIQCSPEWRAHRAKHFNASDAPAMMGASKYKTRTALIKELATGLSAEVDSATQRRFDNGHRAEALARPYAESLIGESFYPVVGCDTIDGLPLSASFDGLTMLHDVCFEHKSLNDDIRNALYDNSDGANLPAMYRIQMEQQLMLSGAEKCLFMATNWNLDTEELLEQHVAWYYPDPELRQRIIAGWKQFALDLENYTHAEAKPEAVAEHIEALPTLLVQVEGRVLATNLDTFKAKAGSFIASIKTELVDDNDFATADKMVKFLADGEKQLASVKQQAQAQAADIDAVFRAIDDISERMRGKRLQLEKLVKAEKESRRLELVRDTQDVYMAHVDKLNERVAGLMPRNVPAFGEAVKGLKTLYSMRDKLSTALANAKIEANEIADRIELNARAAQEHMHLLPDFSAVCTKAADDFAALLALRVQQYENRMEAEREIIRQKEAAKAAEDQRGKADAGVGPELSDHAQPVAASTPPHPVADAGKVITEQKAQIEAFLDKYVQPAKRNNTRAVLMAWEQFKTELPMEHAA